MNIATDNADIARAPDLARLVLGTTQWGLEYGVTNSSGCPSDNELQALLKRAVAIGVRTLDTARAYGDAEARIGRLLDSLPESHRLSIMTKLAPFDGLASASVAEIQSRVTRSVADSLAALGLGHIPTLYLHRVEHLDVCDGEVLRILSHLVEEGCVGRIGVSVYEPAEALAALANKAIAVVQLPLNVLTQAHVSAGVLEAAAEAGKDVYVRSVFLQGLLASPQASNAAWPAALDVYLSRYHAMAESMQMSSAALALSYVRSFSGITGILLGMESVAQLEENAGLFDCRSLSAREMRLLTKEFSDVPVSLTDPRCWRLV